MHHVGFLGGGCFVPSFLVLEEVGSIFLVFQVCSAFLRPALAMA